MYLGCLSLPFPSVLDSRSRVSWSPVLLCVVFHIAVSVSWWACRLGKAKLRVPRAPPVECLGDRGRWLHLDRRAMREWMLIPMALAIGLELPPLKLGGRQVQLPVRRMMSRQHSGPRQSGELRLPHGGTLCGRRFDWGVLRCSCGRLPRRNKCATNPRGILGGT